jgi:hypothetical protein
MVKKNVSIVKLWRGALVVIICFLAGKIPNFALVYSFVGGFAGTLLCYILPLLSYLILEEPKGRSKIVHWGLLTISLLILVVSTAFSGVELLLSMF